MRKPKPESMQKVITDLKITCRSVPGPDRPDWPDASHWTVTLTLESRKMTTQYSMGSSHMGKPACATVLGCVASDASNADQDFESWAEDLGYDSDSRKAEGVWRACQRTRAELIEWAGEHFDRIMSAEW